MARPVPAGTGHQATPRDGGRSGNPRHEAKAVTIKSDLLHTFDILAMGSKNNLQAFNKRLKMYGINYEPGLLDQKDFKNIISE